MIVAFPRECQLHLLCARRDQNSRFPLVTLRDGRLSATDNRVLVSVKCDVTATEHDVFNIDPKAIREACKLAKKGEQAQIQVRESDASVILTDGRTFPVIEGCQPVPAPPEMPEGAHLTGLGVNAKLMYDLSRALGCDQLQLGFYDGVIHVTCIDDDAARIGGRFGLIHPVHLR